MTWKPGRSNEEERLDFLLDALEADCDEAYLRLSLCEERFKNLRALIAVFTTDDLSVGHDDKP